MINKIKSRYKYEDGRLINSVGRNKGREAGILNDNGYRIVSIDSKRFRAHRIIWLLFNGEMPSSDIDHINGIRDDNRIENLRVVSRSENLKNQKIRSDNKSGVIGVSWGRSNGKWCVRIKSVSKYLYLGSYTDFFEACCVRKSAELRLGYHKNHGRVV
jgi:hypothetical protein